MNYEQCVPPIFFGRKYDHFFSTHPLASGKMPSHHDWTLSLSLWQDTDVISISKTSILTEIAIIILAFNPLKNISQGLL